MPSGDAVAGAAPTPEPQCRVGFYGNWKSVACSSGDHLWDRLTRSTGAALYEPWHLWCLAKAYAELGQSDDARRCIDDAIEKVERSKEKWCEAEVRRIGRGNRT